MSVKKFVKIGRPGYKGENNSCIRNTLSKATGLFL